VKIENKTLLPDQIFHSSIQLYINMFWLIFYTLKHMLLKAKFTNGQRYNDIQSNDKKDL
jgi:hypothetical protein